jgi:hypothetical protein
MSREHTIVPLHILSFHFVPGLSMSIFNSDFPLQAHGPSKHNLDKTMHKSMDEVKATTIHTFDPKG